MRGARRLGLYKKPSVPIDVGSEAIDRSSSIGTSSVTVIDYNNPANATGIITSVEIWAYNNLSSVVVATFYEVSSGRFSPRSAVSIGSVTAGSKQTFSVSLNVQEGDYIGLYSNGGGMERNTSGYGGIYYKSGNQTATANVDYTLAAGDAISLYGTGLG